MKNTINIPALEKWYQDNHRPLPFREHSNPYYIWVSEIMAQQTQIETVIPYFNRFIARFPTIEDLAETDSDTLHKMVEGIGYYRRFQHMHEAAKLIVANFDGIFPSHYDAVRSLPGVGEYTAGAIMSIAYDQPFAATDGNVIRVLSRYYGLRDDMRTTPARKKIALLNQALIIKATPRIYTQAMMELGALICRPNNPLCDRCPLQSHCQAFSLQLTRELPVISPLKKPTSKHFITLIVEYNQQRAVIKKEVGLLKGMFLYPQYETDDIYEVKTSLESRGCTIDNLVFVQKVTHVFTHQIWMMNVYKISLSTPPTPAMWQFVDDISTLPMAVAHRKIKI